MTNPTHSETDTAAKESLALSSCGFIDYKKHYSTADLPDQMKSNLGKYYTPPKLVELVRSLVNPYIQPKTVVMDLAAGCGAFLDSFPDNPWIIRDIDNDAVTFLKAHSYIYAENDNSLFQVSRSKYGLQGQDHIACIGNPPYNDISSLVKRQGANAKKTVDFEIDADIRSNDLGTSFLRAYAKIGADVVCVLHPLSYLIKLSNFQRRLGSFKSDYCLKRGVVFSSNEFADTQGTPFPIVAALYVRDFFGMDYGYIREFPFEILDSNERFILSAFETTDGYIQKYAATKEQQHISDIGLYMHNFRDLNSLKSVGNISDTPIPGVTLPVQSLEFYKYAYLNSLRRYFAKDFRWGNLSPLVFRNELDDNDYLRNACIIDTIVNNQRLTSLNLNTTNEVCLCLFQRLAKSSASAGQYDIYADFQQFLDGKSVAWDPLVSFLKQYFQELPIRFLRKIN